jgi:uncharacterized repeat protein (TIGR01451 family)
MSAETRVPEEQKKTPQDLERELQKIYADQEGKLPDFSRLDGKPGSRLTSMLFGAIGALALMAAATWAGLFLFGRTSGFAGERVELRVESSEFLTAGKEAEVTVRWKNDEPIPLARASLRVELPEGFALQSAEPPMPESGEWAVGAIAPGGEGRVTLKGLVRAELDSTLTFQAKLDYKPADFNSDFEKAASHTVVVRDAVIRLSGKGPEQMTPGDEISFVYEIENAHDRPVEGLRFVVDPLDGFLPASAEPASDPEVAMQWTLPTLQPGEKRAVTVRGTFSSTSRGPKSLQGRVGTIGEDGLIAYAKAVARTEVLKSDLALTLIVNGTDKPTAASFGDTLFFTLRFRNAGDVPLREVTLSADLASEPAGHQILDWVSLKDELEGSRNGSVLTWSKRQLEGLALLKPGDEGELDFSVQLIKKPIADVKASRYAVASKAMATVGKAGNVSGPREVASEPLTVTLLSDAAFKAYGRYFTDDGTPLGSGPIPPKVGEKTVYRLHWIIQNTLHELTNLSVTTLLPQGVKWTGVERPVDAGDLSFDETGRKATWRLNKIPTSVPQIAVTFDVEFSPEFEDIGKIVDLTGENRFEAFDKDAGSVILKTEAPIGTDLLGDESAAGKGVVRE